MIVIPSYIHIHIQFICTCINCCLENFAIVVVSFRHKIRCMCVCVPISLFRSSSCWILHTLPAFNCAIHYIAEYIYNLFEDIQLWENLFSPLSSQPIHSSIGCLRAWNSNVETSPFQTYLFLHSLLSLSLSREKLDSWAWFLDSSKLLYSCENR